MFFFFSIIPGVSDGIVTITGTLEQQLRAVALILTKLIEDPNYSQYVNTPISYPGKDIDCKLLLN
jgi:RNA-binding protein Nova